MNSKEEGTKRWYSLQEFTQGHQQHVAFLMKHHEQKTITNIETATQKKIKMNVLHNK